ncbi:MAG: hypothetical protein QOG04_459 [Actinomycetota bacterium]|nr:hypothetical protein [Actinomycetota bacterium]
MAEPDIVAKSADQLLSDAGFDIEGILEGGLSRWSDDGLAIESLPTMTVDELNESRDELIIVDVREGYEFNHIRIPDAVNHPSTQPWTSHQALPHGPLAIICADESRSTFVASVARALGRDARLVRGGMTAWLEGDRPTEGRNSGA